MSPPQPLLFMVHGVDQPFNTKENRSEIARHLSKRYHRQKKLPLDQQSRKSEAKVVHYPVTFHHGGQRLDISASRRAVKRKVAVKKEEEDDSKIADPALDVSKSGPDNTEAAKLPTFQAYPPADAVCPDDTKNFTTGANESMYYPVAPLASYSRPALGLVPSDSWRADPFGCLPIKSDGCEPLMVDYFWQQWAPEADLEYQRSEYNQPHRFIVFPLAMSHPVLLQSIVAMCRVFWLRAQGSAWQNDIEYLKLRGRAVTMVQAKLESPSFADDTTLLAIVCLTSIEMMASNASAVVSHARGLNLILRKRLRERNESTTSRYIKAQARAHVTLANLIKNRSGLNAARAPTSVHQSGQSHLYTSHSTPTYPSYPYSPEMCRAIATMPRGFSELAITGTLSRECIGIVNSLSRKTDEWTAICLGAEVDSELKASHHLLETEGRTNTEYWLLYGLVCFCNQFPDKFENPNPFFNVAMKCFEEAIETQNRISWSADQSWLLWVAIALTGALEICARPIDSRFAVLHAVLDQCNNAHRWEWLEVELRKFLWTDGLAGHWKRCWEEDIAESGSRRPSTSSTMRTSSIPLEGPPQSTPTGRVSKAKKGKRVHACSFDGCGKVFTRAEHRRRHELNHNPEALFPCKQPGCRKAFHRLDLLQRHQERHDLEQQHMAQSGSGRPMTQSSEVPTSMSPAVMASPPTSQGGPRTTSGGLSIGSLVHPQSEYRYGNVGTPNFGGFSHSGLPFSCGFAPSDDSLYFTPESSQSPVSEQYGRYAHRQSVSSSSSVVGLDQNQTSPLMSASSQWIPSSAPPNALPANMFEEPSSYAPTSSSTDSPIPIPLTNLDGDEFDNIRRELSNAPGILPSDAGNGIPDAIRWDCLELYWQHFHPYFPVVHRPTFLPTKPSPLLASAMVAIGSQFDQRPDAKRYSLTLLEVAVRILRRRDTIASRSRLSDLQTVFLLEALSRYFSRRIEVEMSARFRALFASLDQVRRSLGTSALAVFRTLKAERSMEDLLKAHKFWVDHETRRRILQALSILDMQQRIFFGQPATIVQHSHPRVRIDVGNGAMSLPCADELWNATPVEEWERLAKTHQSLEHSAVDLFQSQGNTPQLDYFQFQAWLQHDDALVDQFCYAGEYPKPSLLVDDGHSRSSLTFNKHAMSFIRHTPLTQLLIVSGESWILGKKLESESDFQTAKQALRTWVSTNPASMIALWHATKVLRQQIKFLTGDSDGQTIAATFETTHMLHEPWCVYLAALVCWAHGLYPSLSSTTNPRGLTGASTSDESSANLSAPGVRLLMDPLDAAREAQAYLKATDVARPTSLTNLDLGTLGGMHGLLEICRYSNLGTTPFNCKIKSYFVRADTQELSQILVPRLLSPGPFQMASSSSSGSVELAAYLFTRLRQLGVGTVHGVPGDYNLTLLDYVVPSGLRWVGNCNELNGGYAADGYARVKGLGALVTTFGVGELSAINAIAGAYAERAAVVHIVGSPPRESHDNRLLIHHTFKDGEYGRFSRIYAEVTVAQAIIRDPRVGVEQIDHVLEQCLVHSRPVYIEVPVDLVDARVAADRLKTPVSIPKTVPAPAHDKALDAVLDKIYSAKQPIILVDGESAPLNIVSLAQRVVRETGWPTWVTGYSKGLIDETLPNVHGIYRGFTDEKETQDFFKAADLVLVFGPHFSTTNSYQNSSIPNPLATVSFSDSQITIGTTYDQYPSLARDKSLPFSSVSSDGLINHHHFWPLIASFLRPGDLLFGETGTAGYGARVLPLPRNSRLFTPVTWLSIGYMLPAVQGGALAQRELLEERRQRSKDHQNGTDDDEHPQEQPPIGGDGNGQIINVEGASGRTILFIGDGSFQMTAQELSTVIHLGLPVIIFLLNNDGYTIERCIHGLRQPYNDVARWNYLRAPAFFGATETDTYTKQVRTWGQLQETLADGALTNDDPSSSSLARLRLVEVFLERDDAPPPLDSLLARQIASGRDKIKT
ncbi:hypothetical protein DV735_g2751, partial [Chaetothyriales sp. CBS 134920]